MGDTNEELPIITFNSLYNVLREEEKSASLHSLPTHFYKGVEEFLSSKKQQITSSSSQKDKNTYESSVKIYEKLLKLRAKKIAILAIDTLNLPKEEDQELTSSEKTFKQSIQSEFNKTYNQINK
ncbi:MAG: hypothetical protein ACLFPL_02845 [Candidatus Nanoarchaeia archaeon]